VLEFRRSEQNGHAVVAVIGEVDAHTAPELREALADVLDGGGRNLVVDLADVGLLDSSGLGVILAAFERVRDAGGELRVSCPDPHVRRVFEITGLDGFVGIHDSTDDAVAGLG
jgi:anti-sigma B factor antagonist